MVLKKVALVVLVVSVSMTVFGQSRNNEIGAVTDNDLYTSSKNDQYYTNGMQFFYRYLSKKESGKFLKKLNEFRIGQFIYTPKFKVSDGEILFDRPFAGYLFGEFGNTVLHQNQSVFKKSFQLGYVGPNSFAQEVQSDTHTLFKYRSFDGWYYQIQNALAVQAHFLFSKKMPLSKKSRHIDFHVQSEADFGTIFTGLSAGFVSRIGFKDLVPIYDSNFYGASVNKNSNEINSEFYFYLVPGIKYQMYDTTIQGSLFNDNSPITFDLIPLRFNGEAGVKYRKNNVNLSYAFVYRGKELKHDLNTDYFYGSILISYLFK